jgi:hypothetical protein
LTAIACPIPELDPVTTANPAFQSLHSVLSPPQGLLIRCEFHGSGKLEEGFAEVKLEQKYTYFDAKHPGRQAFPPGKPTERFYGT